MKKILILGDIFVFAVTTIIGFASHGESGVSFLPRYLAIFIPLTAVWFLLAPWFGLFQPAMTSSFKQLWRVPLTMLFAAPLAGTVRGMILQSSIVPIFMVVLGGTSAVGISIWRGIYLLLNRQDR